MKRFFLLCTFCTCLSGFIAPLQADTGLRAGGGFSATMRVIEPTTLSSDRVAVQLAGINLANTSMTPLAKQLLQESIGNNIVRCRLLAVGPPPSQAGQLQVARGICQNSAGEDLSKKLIEQGLAVVQIEHLVGEANIKSAYLQAELQARNTEKGAWATAVSNSISTLVNEKTNVEKLSTSTTTPATSTTFIYTALSVIGAALLLLAIAIFSALRHLSVRVNKLQQTVQNRDRKLIERERYVIAAAIDGELNTNRAKLDAFLLIYEEMLKTLRDPTKKPKYQKAGDIVHEKPALLRSIYDANSEKLGTLGSKLAEEIIALYAYIDANPGYLTLEPEMPLNDVIELIESIVANARHLLEPMDKISGALGIVMRDRRE